MIIVLHVIIALASLVWVTIGYFRPTNTNLRLSYALIALTFLTGSYMVLMEPAQMLRACLSGVTYLAIASAGVLLTRRKIASLQSENI
jgi:hypothetical protein